MIPTREQIQAKINEIRQDPAFSTLRSEIVEKVTLWLESLNLKPITQFGELVDPKDKILEDLDTYDL